MIRLDEHKREIKEIEAEMKVTNSYYRRRDLRKRLNRLKKELAEAHKYLKNAH